MRARPEYSEDLFRAMGKNVFHVGDLGHGLAMKLINNMLGQVATVAIAEALVLGKKAGLDPSKIFEVVSVSTGNSVQFQNRVPRMLARNFAPGGTIDISYKDQELETGYAKALGVPLLMANLSQQVYQMGRAAGLNKEDAVAIAALLLLIMANSRHPLKLESPSSLRAAPPNSIRV